MKYGKNQKIEEKVSLKKGFEHKIVCEDLLLIRILPPKSFQYILIHILLHFIDHGLQSSRSEKKIKSTQT